MPLIGVGGIETAEDIVERMKAGASLVQSRLSSFIISFSFSGFSFLCTLAMNKRKLQGIAR
jgi:hypothetical protein